MGAYLNGHEIKLSLDTGENIKEIVEKTVSVIRNDTVEVIESYVFYYCKSLVYAKFTAAKSVESYAFIDCELLTQIDFGQLEKIGNSSFSRCKNLNTLILRNPAGVCALSATSAFTETPFAARTGSGGTVYVPSALIADYQTATNWSRLYELGVCNFVAIEGSEYE